MNADTIKSGVTVKVCPHCLGARRMSCVDPDADGGRCVVICEGCDGEGRVVVCLERLCGEVMTLREAGVEGAYCSACRHALDASDAEAEARRLRWTA